MKVHLNQEAVMGQAIPRQHPAVVLRSHFRQLKVLLAIMLVALVGLGATVAILATDDESSISTTATPAAQSVRPDESAIAAAIAPKPEVARPDESKVAASLARFEQAQIPVRPDESKVAAAISRSGQPEVARPDESKVAAAISRTQQVQAANGHDESDVAAAISGR
ncbi:MAG TPA: hypothetical protein VFY47_06650 [Thermoleophilaceae bacterium]|nr:hypothetical protein [Thermoleophilaceae bacterium]